MTRHGPGERSRRAISADRIRRGRRFGAGSGDTDASTWHDDHVDDDTVLRTRDGVSELIVNGVFAMDSTEVSSEIALADAALPARRVLVGGLGLGFTAARLLERGVAQVRVVELSAHLVAAARAGATEQLGRLAADPRVELVTGDIADAIGDRRHRPDQSWDAILLDVDNGPTFLIHQTNARLYRRDFLSGCLAALAPGGRVVIWCEAASPDLAATLAALAGSVEVIPVPVTRGQRQFEYVLYRAGAPAAAAPRS